MFWSVHAYAVASAPAAVRPVPEAKSKSSKAAQSVPVSVNKAFVISSFQHTFAYLARAAVMNEFTHLGRHGCTELG